MVERGAAVSQQAHTGCRSAANSPARHPARCGDRQAEAACTKSADKMTLIMENVAHLCDNVTLQRLYLLLFHCVYVRSDRFNAMNPL